MLEDSNELHIEKDKENDTYKIDHPNVLTRGQKLAAASLAFFAFSTVIIWSMQLKNSIGNPFEFRGQNSGSVSEVFQDNETEVCSGSSCQTNKEDTRVKDTDGDGLWDWDEVNVYHTSVYLEDTDSDGILDKDEIDAGSNPNCFEGQNCPEDISGSTSLNSEGDGEEMSQAEMLELLSQLEKLETNMNGTEDVVSDEKVMQDLLGGKASADSLRTILKEAGIDGAALDGLSDEELLAVYKDMLK